MRQKIEGFCTFGQDLLFQLQIRSPFWRYSIYCFLQKLKRRVETWSTYWSGLMWRCWRRVQTIGIRIKKNMRSNINAY